jgi:hypothetical protein
VTRKCSDKKVGLFLRLSWKGSYRSSHTRLEISGRTGICQAKKKLWVHQDRAVENSEGGEKFHLARCCRNPQTENTKTETLVNKLLVAQHEIRAQTATRSISAIHCTKTQPEEKKFSHKRKNSAVNKI